MAAAEAGEPQVSADYHLPDADVAALRARLKEHRHLERIRAAYNGGAEGCIDDCIAMTRPWGIDLAQVHVPVSVWYGPDDALSPHGHAEWLLAHIPNADRQELPLGGHLLGDNDLDSIYRWLRHKDLATERAQRLALTRGKGRCMSVRIGAATVPYADRPAAQVAAWAHGYDHAL